MVLSLPFTQFMMVMTTTNTASPMNAATTSRRSRSGSDMVKKQSQRKPKLMLLSLMDEQILRDDDDSISSTLPVDDSSSLASTSSSSSSMSSDEGYRLQQRQPSFSLCQKKNKKRVHFAVDEDDRGMEYEASDIDSSPSTTPFERRRLLRRSSSKKTEQLHQAMENKEACWYNAADYRTFRVAALDAAQQIVATEKRNRAPFSYQRVMEHTYQACSCNCDSVDDMEADGDSTMMDQHKDVETAAFCRCRDGDGSDCHIAVLCAADALHLQRWLEVATSRLGLEKWSVRSIAADKAERRLAMYGAVAVAAAKATTARRRDSVRMVDTSDSADDDDDDDDVAAAAECLRGTCAFLSRPSRLFSQTLAQALAAAVQKGNRDDEAAAAAATL